VHSNFDRIGQYPLVLLPDSAVRCQLVLWWFVPISTWTFLAFFATSKEAIREYQDATFWFATRVLRRPLVESTGFLGTPKCTRSYPSPIASSCDTSLVTIPTPTESKWTAVGSPSNGSTSSCDSSLHFNTLPQHQTVCLPDFPHGLHTPQKFDGVV